VTIQIQLRRGTATQWTAGNPILAAGELGLETDTTKIKIGDGSTSWTSLAYAAMTGTEYDANVGALRVYLNQFYV